MTTDHWELNIGFGSFFYKWYPWFENYNEYGFRFLRFSFLYFAISLEYKSPEKRKAENDSRN